MEPVPARLYVVDEHDRELGSVACHAVRPRPGCWAVPGPVVVPLDQSAARAWVWLDVTGVGALRLSDESLRVQRGDWRLLAPEFILPAS